MLTKLSYLIDNPWSNALDRARQAGQVLADILLNRRLGVRPVSLIGYSLGARVIFFALLELAKQNAFGVVQEVYLFGATVTASIKIWRQVRGVVSGRFVNAFAMNDWVLGYLFRATTGGLQTVAGLRPIEHVPDLENVDITHILEGHMSYRTKMPKLLAYVGFKTTADHFDEPDFDPDGPDREVLTPEEIERRQFEKEKRERGALGIFMRRKKNPGEASSQPLSRTASGEEYDGPLPPRFSASSDSRSPSMSGTRPSSLGTNSKNASTTSVDSTKSLGRTADPKRARPAAASSDSLERKPDAAPPGAEPSRSSSPPPQEAPIPREPPVPSGFDLDKLREEVSQLPRPAPERAASLPRADSYAAAASGADTDDPARPPSAPPPLEPPQSDLRELDRSLDPRELLRRQWNGEAVPSVSSENPALSLPAAAAWDSSVDLPDDQYAGGFSFPSSSPAAGADMPSFTFGNGDDFESSSTPSHPSDAPAPSFAWSRSSSSDMTSHNPW